MHKMYEKNLKLLETLANWLKISKFSVVLTGAGISVPSGIPDFRSKDGVYAKYGQKIFDIETFNKFPEEFYEFAREELLKMLDAEPNKAHILLSNLEKTGIIKGVITQNIDNLHKKAGTQNIAEIHGSARTWTCLKCNKRYDLLNSYESNQLLSQNFRCSCGGRTKPDIVFFGEMLPLNEFSRAENWSKKSDLFITMGTSLVVYPAAQLPIIAKSNGAKLIIINNTETPFDDRADLKIELDVIEVSEKLSEILKIT
ncbi:MAG: SIR2 family NAD-dependent protein deacylase [Fervidobacterium sp.]